MQKTDGSWQLTIDYHKLIQVVILIADADQTWYPYMSRLIHLEYDMQLLILKNAIFSIPIHKNF